MDTSDGYEIASSTHVKPIEECIETPKDMTSEITAMRELALGIYMARCLMTKGVLAGYLDGLFSTPVDAAYSKDENDGSITILIMAERPDGDSIGMQTGEYSSSFFAESSGLPQTAVKALFEYGGLNYENNN